MVVGHSASGQPTFTTLCYYTARRAAATEPEELSLKAKIQTTPAHTHCSEQQSNVMHPGQENNQFHLALLLQISQSKDKLMEFKKSCLSITLLFLPAPDQSLTFSLLYCYRVFTLNETIELAQENTAPFK